MRLIEDLHERRVFARRVSVLALHLAELLPPNTSVLDVGTGDGSVASEILRRRPDLTIRGVDVLVRKETQILVTEFDGRQMPFSDHAFDTVMFVDVLHHTEDPLALLKEAGRVARGRILIKDHCREGILAGPTLRFMDWVGNARHGVALPYTYWPRLRWHQAFEALGLEIRSWRSALGLYPFPTSMLFGRGLHFIADLRRLDDGRRV